jgi:catechol 2,3-dioxygenase-like lactoylglutathione lyase family enzyme
VTCSRSCSTAGRSQFVRTPQPVGHHLAIRVTPETFTAAIERLTGRGIAFGNDPEDVTNGRTDDPLGGAGRAYFTDSNGHLYELVAVATG